MWECSAYRSNPGMYDTYMEYVRTHATVINAEAKKQGLIVDYKTFVKPPADPNDWDFMSCTAYESFARALDHNQGDEEKFDAIAAKHWATADQDKQQELSSKRLDMRKFIGDDLHARSEPASDRLSGSGKDSMRKPASCRLSFVRLRWAPPREHRGPRVRVHALAPDPARIACAPLPARADTVLTVMTFNTWGGGANEGKPIDETAAVIRAAGADIVGIQETRQEAPACSEESCPPASESVAAKLAAALGFHYYDQAKTNDALWANAILSRYPIGAATPNDLGVAIDVPGRRVFAFNIHFTDFPYQPYQVFGIPYGDAPYLKSGAEAVQAAAKARGTGVALLVEDLKAAEGADAAFVFGDFNEPSHRDWTARYGRGWPASVRGGVPDRARRRSAGIRRRVPYRAPGRGGEARLHLGSDRTPRRRASPPRPYRLRLCARRRARRGAGADLRREVAGSGRRGDALALGPPRGRRDGPLQMKGSHPFIFVIWFERRSPSASQI